MTFLDVLLQQGINGLMLGIMYSLVAVGFTLYFGVLNVINFSHGDFYMLGSFMALILVTIAESLGWVNNSLAYILFLFAGSMILTSIIGVLSARLAVKPVLKAPMLISLLVTLGLGIAIREAVRVLYPRGSDPKGFPALFPEGAFQLGGVLIRYENIIILVVGIIAIVLIHLIINKTKIGSSIRAVAQDSEAAMMMGVNMDRTIDITFIISGSWNLKRRLLRSGYVQHGWNRGGDRLFCSGHRGAGEYIWCHRWGASVWINGNLIRGITTHWHGKQTRIRVFGGYSLSNFQTHRHFGRENLRAGIKGVRE